MLMGRWSSRVGGKHTTWMVTRPHAWANDSHREHRHTVDTREARPTSSDMTAEHTEIRVSTELGTGVTSHRHGGGGGPAPALPTGAPYTDLTGEVDGRTTLLGAATGRRSRGSLPLPPLAGRPLALCRRGRGRGRQRSDTPNTNQGEGNRTHCCSMTA